MHPITRLLVGWDVGVLPSPSGAACRYWSSAPWHELARLRGELAGAAK